MHSFEVHSNESACRKSGRLGLEQVKIKSSVKSFCDLIDKFNTKVRFQFMVPLLSNKTYFRGRDGSIDTNRNLYFKSKEFKATTSFKLSHIGDRKVFRPFGRRIVNLHIKVGGVEILEKYVL